MGKKTAKRRYDGAKHNRLTSDWVTSSTSADSEIVTALRPLRNRARELTRNNDYAKGAINTMVRNVVGQGFGFQSQVMMKRSGRPLESVNSQIEAAWLEWQSANYCHTAGKLCFSDIESLLIKSLIESGEVLIRLIKQSFDGSPVPLSLEVIEADQLCDDHAVNNYGGNIVKMGVELDSWQRPVAYHLYPYHPGDSQFHSAHRGSRLIRVPADEVLHLFITDRPGQTRGVPWFHATMIRLRHMGGYEEAEIVAARAQAAVSGFVESPDPENLSLISTEEGMEGSRIKDLSPGSIEYLAPGEKFQGFAPTRPNQGFEAFLRSMLRGVAASIGISYESLSRDFSNTSYSSARTSLLEERDCYQILQSWMVKHFHSRVFKEWLPLAVLSGRVNCADYFQNSDYYCQPKFTCRGWSWVDPLKEVTANTMAVKGGMKTLTGIAAESGQDFEDLVRTRSREMDLLKQYGVNVETEVADIATEDEPMIVSEKAWRERNLSRQYRLAFTDEGR